jgi:hypothetical protein
MGLCRPSPRVFRTTPSVEISIQRGVNQGGVDILETDRPTEALPRVVRTTGTRRH